MFGFYLGYPPGSPGHVGVRWVALFEGDFSEAKSIIDRLKAEDIPNRLVFPDPQPTPFTVKIEVMKHWFPRAQELMAS
ncbi:MAG: hypothetical protein QOI81_1890 [Actinomycetota bacterium]|nr:hypothetical protein [Actinomycetota bacterium]